MEYTNADLTVKADLLNSSVADLTDRVDILDSSVLDVFPTSIIIEPSTGTVANNLDTYVDASTGIGTLFVKVGTRWLSFDVSIV